MITRRHFLQAAGAGGLLAALANARLAFADAPGENRLIVIVLRGGLDALHALPPYADPDYRALRPRLAIGAPGTEEGAIDLNGSFGLHPSLAPLKPLYASRELLLVPAATTRYRNRSHFDGQNMLENGSAKPYGAPDGWLNRAIAQLGAPDRRLGLALGPAIPLLLQGDESVRTWAPSILPKVDDDFLDRLAALYREDTLFSGALADARGSNAPSMSAMPDGPRRRGQTFEAAAKVAADLLSQSGGPRIAAMESHGWDTHFAQARRLENLLAELARGIVLLKSGLGPAWRHTVVVVVSEFGRTAAENGSLGTDHGVGGLALLAGGAVLGGRIAGSWPGLSRAALHEGRDLRPTTDYESIFKSVLMSHLGIAPSLLEDRVFPGSRASRPLDQLIRTA